MDYFTYSISTAAILSNLSYNVDE